MIETVDLPGEVTVIRENGYDSDGDLVTRIEVRTLVSYTRLLVENNNLPNHLATPGFRHHDLRANILTMMSLYHEHRHSSPCEFIINLPQRFSIS